jgi:hypothetical protein
LGGSIDEVDVTAGEDARRELFVELFVVGGKLRKSLLTA